MKAASLLEKVTKETVASRHSVRDYTTTPVSEENARELEEIINECNTQGNLHMQLVTEEPEAFGKSRLAHYGKFRNVRNYIGLVGLKAGGTEERLGYYGEIIVLRAQQMGLNTCWVGLTYSKSNSHIDIGEGEKLYAVISIGHGTTQGFHHKIKKPRQVASSWENAPEWFRRGVECALLAPTAVNQQKFRFEHLSEYKVRATTSWGFFSKMDLGIAKLHFEYGAMGHDFDWTE